eukprot:4999811-Pleurochrysis_carterae.AAC.2
MCEFFGMHTLDEGESCKHRVLSKKNRSRWEGVLTSLTGWHNIHKAPIICAPLTIRFGHN